jgi:dTDP-glucose 4,6-dehydratase
MLKPKLLVTGGAGFMGSEFVRQAANRGFDTIIIDKLTYAGDLERLKEIDGKYKFYKADICNRTKIETIFNKEKPKIVVHFAAQTHVDRSIKDASPFIETNVKGTQILLEAARKSNIEKFVHVSCYDEKTRALTTEGLKTYKELREGDKVFSLNPETQTIETKPIEKVIIQHYKGKMVHFKNKRINLLVTPNHRMFILNTSKKNKKLIVETAEKASQRSVFFMPEGNWIGKNEKYFNVEGFGSVNTKDLMYILGVFIGDGFIAYQEKERVTKTGLSRRVYLEEARDKRTGRFKTIEKLGNHVSTTHGYRIFFDIPKNDKCRRKVEKVLRRLGIKYHCHEGKAGTHLYFTSKILMDLFAQCGHGAYNKRIPRWVLNYSPEYLNYLLEGLMDSDGRNGKIYHTVSEILASDVCELCIKLNLKPNIHRRHTKSFINNRKLEGDSYVVSVGKTIKSIIRHRNKIINYDGDIWCLKVKDNKNFLVERAGRFNFCGNTDEVYGEIKNGKFDEDSPLKPNSPYAASKAAGDLLIRALVRTYNFPAIIIRPCNNYGPWQYPEKLIPLAILKILRNEKIPVYGNGTNVREWLYVQDCIEGIFQILEKGRIGSIYNLSSQEEKCNIEVIRLILRILRKGEDLIEFVKDRPGHDYRYSLDCTNIYRLGWRPRHNFTQALELTVRWYLGNLSWWQKIRQKREYKLYYNSWYGRGISDWRD